MEQVNKSETSGSSTTNCKCNLRATDWVSILKERADKAKKIQPSYHVVEKTGEEHHPLFLVQCIYDGKQVSGSGRSIREAKRSAAHAWIAGFGSIEIAESSMGVDQIMRIAHATWSLGKACMGYPEPDLGTLKMSISRIGLSAAQVAQNLSPKSVVIFILQIATEFGYTPDVLLQELSKLLMMVADCSKQLIQSLLANITALFAPVLSSAVGEVAQASFDLPEFEPAQLAGAAGALGGCAVLIAALLTGVKDYSSQKGFLRHIAEFSSKLSKFKGGLYALMEMVKHFSGFVRESVLRFMGACTPSTIVRAVESLNLQHKGQPLRSDEFFSMLEKLNSLEGEEVMSMNPDALADGQFALHIVSKITTQNMAETFQIPASAIMALCELRRAFEPRVRAAALRQAACKTRFVPFSIWLAGPSGVGKSVTMSHIQTWLMKALEKEPEKYELPAEERYFFSANFTQEYHTGYSGQYVFAIDDMCQDRPGTLKNSSALQFIQWVSNIPANVTQAALEDKKCPFASKVILCSSNVTHPNRSQEIVEQEAFLRRRHMLIYAAQSKDMDPYLHRKIQFSLLDSKREANCISSPIRKYSDFKDLMVDVVNRYRVHFDEQKQLEASVGAGEGIFEFLNQLEEQEYACASADYQLPENWKFDNLIRQCKFVGTKFCDYMETLTERSIWKIVAGISAAAAVAFGFYRWSHRNDERSSWVDVSLLADQHTPNSDCDCTLCEMAISSYDNAVPKRSRPKVHIRTEASYNKELVRARRAKPGPLAIRSSFVQSLHVKNVVKLTRHVGSAVCSQNGVFVAGRTLLTCRHFFYDMKEGESFKVTEYPQYDKPHESSHAFVSARMKPVVGAVDAVLYEMGSEVMMHKNIINKFFQHDLPDIFQAAAIGVHPEPIWQTGIAQVITRKVSHYIGVDTDSELVTIEGFEMAGVAVKGRSGSVLASDETQNRAPTIFGIQVSISANKNNSYFEAITREQIEKTCELLVPEFAGRSMDFCDEVPDEMQGLCKSSIVYVRPADEPINQMKQSQLRPSILSERFERDETLREYLPAALSSRAPGVDAKFRGQDPLMNSMAGYERSYGIVDLVLADKVLGEFSKEDRHTRKHAHLKPRLLTNHEVLNGIPGEGLKGVELNTSPGLPYVLKKDKGKTGKQTWIRMNENQERIMDESLWTEFRELEEQLREGEQPEFLAYACLKDELRPVEKVRDMKTRTFIILPMLMNFLIRKYFGVWTAVQHSKAGKISSCVGIDVNSDWTNLRKRLLKGGPAIEDFDYTEWDRSLHAEWFRIYADRVSAWYGDRWGSEGFVVRRSLMDILAHMRIQIGGHIVQTYGGNKSGCAITAEVNTDVHDMLAYYVWVKVCRESDHAHLAHLDSFRENVELALYGDDMVKASSHAVAKWFNGNTIIPHISALGMIITPGDKLAKEFTIKKIEEVTFLKRRFLEFRETDFGQVRAPLDKSVIQRMALWVHKSDDPVAACKANVRGALCEAFFWGEDFFNDFEERARSAWDQSMSHGVSFPIVDYNTLHYNWINRVLGDIVPAQFQFRIDG